MILARAAVIACALGHPFVTRARPTWVDDLLDPLPLVSQIKTVYHFARSERDKAVATSDRFTQRCPGISQLRSLLELAEGDVEAARQTQTVFLNQPGEFVKDFVARESIREAELLGNELTSRALGELEALMEDAVRRLPVQSKSLFIQLAQTFAAICSIHAIFRTTGGAREMLAVAWKGVLALVVLLALDVVMNAALEDAAVECCPCDLGLARARLREKITSRGGN